jgi:hypothetical protein
MQQQQQQQQQQEASTSSAEAAKPAAAASSPPAQPANNLFGYELLVPAGALQQAKLAVQTALSLQEDAAAGEVASAVQPSHPKQCQQQMPKQRGDAEQQQQQQSKQPEQPHDRHKRQADSSWLWEADEATASLLGLLPNK